MRQRTPASLTAGRRTLCLRESKRVLFESGGGQTKFHSDMDIETVSILSYGHCYGGVFRMENLLRYVQGNPGYH